MTPVDITILVLLAVLTFVVLRGQFMGRGTDGKEGYVQQQIDTLRNEVQENLRATTESVSRSLLATQETMVQTLKLTADQMNSQLTSVNTHLGGVASQLQENTGQMGSRLDNAARVIQDVQKQLGELGTATENIRELGMNVGKLEEMLRAPKLRGGLGELLLEDLLRQVLPVNAYAMQHKFRSGEKVDAVIHTSGGMVPVDSKFPLENFRRLVDAKTDQERNAAARTFRQDVKKHIDDISRKYILPDEGTFDFALMYIPAENIYYETIIKDEKFDEEDGLYAYASKHRVVPVSPNSFYAHLRVIALGFKGLQVEANAKEIIKTLDRLGYEIQKFRGTFETLGTHLTNARNNYDKAEKSLTSFEEKLNSAQQLKDDQAPVPLPVPGVDSQTGNS